MATSCHFLMSGAGLPEETSQGDNSLEVQIVVFLVQEGGVNMSALNYARRR